MGWNEKLSQVYICGQKLDVIALANMLSSATMLSTSSGNLQISLQWRHNDRNGVSNHQPHHCLFNRLFRRRSKKTPKLRVTGLLCVTGEFPAQRPVTLKMFPFDDVIMMCLLLGFQLRNWNYIIFQAIHFLPLAVISREVHGLHFSYSGRWDGMKSYHKYTYVARSWT